MAAARVRGYNGHLHIDTRGEFVMPHAGALDASGHQQRGSLSGRVHAVDYTVGLGKPRQACIRVVDQVDVAEPLAADTPASGASAVEAQLAVAGMGAAAVASRQCGRIHSRRTGRLLF
jgi:hypothetical protein